MCDQQFERVDTYERDAERVCQSLCLAEAYAQAGVAAWSHGDSYRIEAHVVAAQMLHALAQEAAQARGMIVALPLLEVQKDETVRRKCHRTYIG